MTDFGSNPGRLAMFLHQPRKRLAAGAPLVVLLHGCGQTAPGFAAESGWVAWADRHGAALVLPEQSGENNCGRCFNWFQPLHVRRGFGEALSIRQMVAAAINRFGSNTNQVFIAGLSAGGAMTAAVLAAYPEVFAGGAIVAGLPVGAASSAAEGLARMVEAGPARSLERWAQQVRRAAPVGHTGPWPRVSIWHGLADEVVDPTNAHLLAQQFSALHTAGGGTIATKAETACRVIWGPPDWPAVELWMLPGRSHVWPDEAVDRIARFWGLGRASRGALRRAGRNASMA